MSKKILYRESDEEKMVNGYRYKRFTFVDFWYTSLDGLIAEAKRNGYHFVVDHHPDGVRWLRPIEEIRETAKRRYGPGYNDSPQVYDYRLKLPRKAAWRIRETANVLSKHDVIQGLNGIEVEKKKD